MCSISYQVSAHQISHLYEKPHKFCHLSLYYLHMIRFSSKPFIAFLNSLALSSFCSRQMTSKAPSTRIRFYRKRYRFQCKRNDCIASTHRFHIIFILFSLESVFKSYRFQSFSYRCKVKMQRKVCDFNENDMKTYLC